MDFTIFKNDKNLSLNGVNKIVGDVYKDNLDYLMRKNKSELERRETDKFSYEIEVFLNSLDGEETRLYEEKDKIKESFQTIALQLKNVKRSIIKTDEYIENKVKGVMLKNSQKIFEAFKKDINNL
ncbi:conserved Plasmodium protein, unknown function [Plasmodium vinckei]|uniref:Uncharacterized protein n=3 Tax=Plasmodium vinckei TaxID=5860 RepID=W7AXF6_PLAVN|nr:hypothetical protein YYG_04719 [Plasmodium vinckei petteri]CAD2083679.1 conserved Plasmodium protein, unknown function [Plasmodium vinckei brucechwatti]CAD2095176.1 conserved Plasmodium protein, unknown function [Plasmodium vinckei petteri]CAD2095359.1 conserved Plasmodium protein, unknown function [Plasmodium vinckei]